VLAHPLPGQDWVPFFGTVAGSVLQLGGGYIYRVRLSEYEAVDVVGAAVMPIPADLDAARISVRSGVA